MKKTFLSFFLCLCSLFAMAQYGTQFENRGFESWANFGSGNSTIEPVHWHSTKSASGTFSGFLSQQIEPSTQVRPGSTGSKSARLWPTSVMGVTANGNLTNGRMNAGSMSATGSNNYNYTQRSDERFNTPINTIPDSLSVWVCFRSADPNQNGQARAVVHGDADFRFVSNGTVEPADKLVATATSSFKRTSGANGSYVWKRLSIPFIQNGPCHDPRYILFTITTNEIPGEGGTADDLYVDDVLLIYNPSIQMGSLDKDQYLIGESLTIPFALQGTMSPENLGGTSNQVIAQLSSANGSFSNPTELGRMTTSTSGDITVTIPQGIYTGEHYRIRLVTTNYPMVSEDNGQDLTITSNVDVLEQLEQPVCIVPNPAHDRLYLSSEQEINDVELYTMDGKKVLSQQGNARAVELCTASVRPGMYLVRCCLNETDCIQKVMIR